MTTRALLADDHLLFAQALAQMLSHRYEIVDIAGDGKALLAASRKHKPDVIVTDITMPLMSGLETVRSLQKDLYTPKVIFVTMHQDSELARACFNAGASAFVSKEFSYEELLVAIEAVMAGQLYLSPNVASGLVDALRGPAPVDEETNQLTARQREILQLFAEGKSTKEIATVTNLSTRTVEWHKYRMMRLLHAKRSAELIQHAVKMKLVV